MLIASSATVTQMPLPNYVEPLPDWFGAGFAADMVFSTINGLAPAAWLRAGDLVQTRDNGMQPLVLLERQDHQSDLMVQSDQIADGALLPASQRALVAGWKLELNFGHDEMLVTLGAISPVKPRKRISDTPLYILAFEQPQLIFSGGLWLEASSMAAEKPTRPHMTGPEVQAVGLGIDDLMG